jgi:hypothetical protein
VNRFASPLHPARRANRDKAKAFPVKDCRKTLTGRPLWEGVKYPAAKFVLFDAAKCTYFFELGELMFRLFHVSGFHIKFA